MGNPFSAPNRQDPGSRPPTFYTGRKEEALDQVRRAAESEPLSPVVNQFLRHVLCSIGRYDEAGDHMRHALTLEPKCHPFYLWSGMPSAKKGEFDAAIAALERGAFLSGSDCVTLGSPRWAYDLASRAAKARKVP